MMRKIVLTLVASMLLWQAEAVAQLEATDPRPELKALHDFDGNWSFKGTTEQGDEVAGYASFDWVLGGRFQRFHASILDDDGNAVWEMWEYRGWDGKDQTLKGWNIASHGGIGIVTLQKKSKALHGDSRKFTPDGESVTSVSTMMVIDTDTMKLEGTSKTGNGSPTEAKYTLKRVDKIPSTPAPPTAEPVAELRDMDFFTGKWKSSDVFTEEGKVRDKVNSEMNSEWVLNGRAQFQETFIDKDGKSVPMIHAVTYWNPATKQIEVKTFWPTGVHESCVQIKKDSKTWELPFESVAQDGEIVKGKGVFTIKDDKTFHYDSDWTQGGKACHWHAEATRQ